MKKKTKKKVGKKPGELFNEHKALAMKGMAKRKKKNDHDADDRDKKAKAKKRL